MSTVAASHAAHAPDPGHTGAPGTTVTSAPDPTPLLSPTRRGEPRYILGTIHTVSSLAAAVGRSASWVSLVFHGRRSPSTDALADLAQALNLTMEQLHARLKAVRDAAGHPKRPSGFGPRPRPTRPRGRRRK